MKLSTIYCLLKTNLCFSFFILAIFVLQLFATCRNA